MITDLIHFELLSSFEENNIDLEFLKTLKLTNMNMYRCNRYHELYAFGKVIEIVSYLFFYKERLIRVDYRIGIELFDSFKEDINELLDEKFKLKDLSIYDYISYEGKFKALTIIVEELTDKYFLFKIGHDI